ncbi:hypothetical protein, partial [Hanstruepera marina]|uniref:hypothetical protein n=1 Tax=Hanstruepera marina TaxID=2873265 RepID=UPI001CA67E2E
DEVNAAFDAWVATGTITGGCNLDIVIDNPGAPDACGGETVVTWTATSSCADTISGSATFSVEPAPAIEANVPSDSGVGSCLTQDEVNAAFDAWVATGTITGGCNLDIVIDNPGAPDACGGETVVTWTATSSCADTISGSATFSVEPAPAIEANVPGDSGVGSCLTQDEVNAAFDAWVATGTITGGCNLDIVIDNPGAPDACGGETVVTWTATSSCADTISGSATFSVEPDTEVPVITTKNQSMDLGCNPEVVAPEFMASDNCGPVDVEVSTEGPQNAGGWDCSYSQTWTATAMDSCGNVAESVSITYTWIQDTLPPKVSCSGIEAGDLGCNPDEIPTGESLIDLVDTDDNCIGSSEVFVYDTVLDDEGCERSVTYTFAAIDSCGNETYDFERCSVTYTWTVDTEAPVITSDSQSGDFGCNPEIIPPLFKVDDNCMDGDLDIESETEGPIADGCNYTQTWTANYTDACGNVAEALSITYTWIVSEDIVANVPGDSGVGSCLTQDEVNAAFDAWVATGTITGGCNLDIVIDNPGAPDACGGETVVTWTATADCEEPVSGSATFSVEPAPAIEANVPGDSGVGSCLTQDEVNAAFDAWVATGTITGGCNLDIVIDNPGAPDACGGETVVTWT